ncbi:MAG: DNA-binding protein H-NS [Sulfitobacter sp.]|jgi:DNA-binding protein H-NS
MKIDLKNLNSKELEKLLGDVKKALNNARARDRSLATKAAQKAAAEFGFSLTELSADLKAPAKARKTKAKGPVKKSKPQFANPADPTQTWTGKGRQPNWFRAQTDKGTSPDAMRIAD